MPVKMMPDETVLISCRTDNDNDRGDMHDDYGSIFLATKADTSEMALPIGAAQEDETYSLDYDDNGACIELRFPS